MEALEDTGGKIYCKPTDESKIVDKPSNSATRTGKPKTHLKGEVAPCHPPCQLQT